MFNASIPRTFISAGTSGRSSVELSYTRTLFGFQLALEFFQCGRGHRNKKIALAVDNRRRDLFPAENHRTVGRTSTLFRTVRRQPADIAGYYRGRLRYSRTSGITNADSAALPVLQQKLTPREVEILVHRYGLYGQIPMTQREVAKKMGISRSYVSRLEKRAIAMLRKQYDQTTFSGF